MKKITVWSVISIKKDEKGKETISYKHNHIENGWSEHDKPQPLSPSFTNQNAWLKMEWKREHKHLENHKVL